MYVDGPFVVVNVITDVPFVPAWFVGFVVIVELIVRLQGTTVDVGVGVGVAVCVAVGVGVLVAVGVGLGVGHKMGGRAGFSKRYDHGFLNQD